ncbi:MAG: VOC family protein [Actinomycetota bacterium]|nr:MAG: VOC family protein [Actinomycetota bacterium]
MPPRVSLITLGVADVERSTAFYQAWGWPLSPASVPGEVSFFGTDGGFLAVWRREDLAADARQTLPGNGFRDVSLAVNCRDREEADEAVAAAVAAGAVLVRPAEPTDWGGYVGYLTDPDGHLWEIAVNPAWPIGPDGRPALPR